MGYLYVLMGKSATGKDSIYKELLHSDLGLEKAVIYTTRPKRTDEVEGVQYHFSTKEAHDRYEMEGKLIESRCFHTVMGDWYYFTVDDGKIELEKNSYLLINTLEGFIKTRDYYGADKVLPIYVEVPDGERIKRAVLREEGEKTPNYDELCRRFLADNKDFSEENLKQSGVLKEHRFTNDILSTCVEQIRDYMREKSQKRN